MQRISNSDFLMLGVSSGRTICTYWLSRRKDWSCITFDTLLSLNERNLESVTRQALITETSPFNREIFQCRKDKIYWRMDISDCLLGIMLNSHAQSNKVAWDRPQIKNSTVWRLKSKTRKYEEQSGGSLSLYVRSIVVPFSSPLFLLNHYKRLRPLKCGIMLHIY